MIFASQTFLFGFLPLFFILYLAAGKFFGLRGKNTVLFFMSLIFYAWGEPVYIVLMIYSSVLDYVCGRMIYSADRQEKNGKKKEFFDKGIDRNEIRESNKFVNLSAGKQKTSGRCKKESCPLPKK